MKKTMLSLVCLSLFTIIFIGCADEGLPGNVTTAVQATSRTAGNMSLRIVKADRSEVNLTASQVSVTEVAGTGFTVVSNPGTYNSQTFTALELYITEPDNKMKVTLNPGLGQTVYSNKSSFVADEDGGYRATINAGNIVTSATQIIIEENDGF